MAKKRQNVSYDRESLNQMALEINRIRRPMVEGKIPHLQINLDDLEKTVKGLPVKEREKLEKFWGLVPGTIKRYKNPLFKIVGDLALKNMADDATRILFKLISIEYLYMFDGNARKLVNDFASKINKRGFEAMSDIDALNYLIIFFVFICGGPQMNYDNEKQKIQYEKEKLGHFDKFGLLNAIWEDSGHKLPDHSINLGLLISVIEMFELKDVIAMKKYVGLPISIEDSDIETEPTSTFWDIRKFKERIFSQGEWVITNYLIYNQGSKKLDLSAFEEKIAELRSNWNTVYEFEVESSTMKTSEGEKRINIYKIGGLGFSDIYEVMTLYICRNYL